MLKADPETKTWVRAVYLGDNPRKNKEGHGEGRWGRDKAKTRCVSELVTLGYWAPPPGALLRILGKHTLDPTCWRDAKLSFIYEIPFLL